MKKIPMADLHSQYLTIKPEIDRAVLDVIDSTQFINGQVVKDFSAALESFLYVKHVIPCANGTDALQIAFMALGLKPGDEVILPVFTYVATAEVIALLGLVPVMIDVDPDTFNLDIEAFKAAITPKTKAVVPVHLFGQCAQMEEVLQIAKEKGLFVVEDTAQALSAVYTFSDGTQQMAGTMGDFGTTSFFPSKNLGCYGDGGALFTNNSELAEKARMVANHGQKKRYYHEVIGMNSRLDSIQAAILQVKLPHLKNYSQTRFEKSQKYHAAFKEIQQLQCPVFNPKSTHVFHQYNMRVLDGNRDALKDYLTENNISSAIYYPVPLHEQKAFAQPGIGKGSFPVSEQLCTEVLALPISPDLSEEDQNRIIKTIQEFYTK